MSNALSVGVQSTLNGATPDGVSSDLLPVLITGGCGFVGTNLAHRLLSGGRRVIVFDNCSRLGVERDREWLQHTHGDRVEIVHGDVRDANAVREVVARAGQVFHFAAQVAVTTSLVDPITDFEINARGTLNLLEAMRSVKNPPSLVFTSTNKVYGGLEDVGLQLNEHRYEPQSTLIRENGISEARPLDFHSPYGCSKGAADQYVIDYARTYNLPAVVFRMSCIYGPHQFGNEDQGWVAHFLIQAQHSRDIVLYGDGKQVRDALFVEDLVDAFLLAQQKMAQLSGQASNIGGGAESTTSLLELIDQISVLSGRRIDVRLDDWRPGDQRYYVSDTRKFQNATGWKPQVSVQEGITRLWNWLQENAADGVADNVPHGNSLKAVAQAVSGASSLTGVVSDAGQSTLNRVEANSSRCISENATSEEHPVAEVAAA